MVNARFNAMTSHYLFEATFCNPASGWEKGQIEKNVQDARRRVWQNAPAFASLGALNEWLELRCLALWAEVQHPEDKTRTIAEVWADEQPHLMALPPPFDGFVEHTKRVSPTCLLNFERDRYSVPSPFANRAVSLRVYAERLVVVAEGEVIAEHVRLLGHSTIAPVARCTTGGITWPLCSVNPVPCAMAHRLVSCPRPSNACSPSCSNASAVIERWRRFWRWCCIMTSKPCCARSSLRSNPMACPSSIF